MTTNKKDCKTRKVNYLVLFEIFILCLHKYFIQQFLAQVSRWTTRMHAALHINEVIKSNHKDYSDNYKHPKRSIAHY